ncbi:hypothetical protein Bpfe_023866 [Biomphalaria pfeifferi]|uniref:DUF19 domain-containing protein n=1 Tax=Biomphalaria pfeifferi TaxID=112525 RepID=A0AAD8B299_BIOPF|nr:hypothetical protein Bpfe_023866 [Biomphalaria pfeifferi]
MNDFGKLWSFADQTYYTNYCRMNDEAKACVKKLYNLENNCKEDMRFVTVHLKVSSFLCSNNKGKNAVKNLPKSICANNELPGCLYQRASSACSGKYEKEFSSCISTPLAKACGNDIIYILKSINEIFWDNEKTMDDSD